MKKRLFFAISLFLVIVTLIAFKTHSGKFVLYRTAKSIKHRVTPDVSFKSADWRDASLVYHKPFIRNQMVKDLMKRYQLVGMTKQEIHQLLGKPDSAFQATYHYILRPDGWGDAMVLELDFDKRGKVSGARISNN